MVLGESYEIGVPKVSQGNLGVPKVVLYILKVSQGNLGVPKVVLYILKVSQGNLGWSYEIGGLKFPFRISEIHCRLALNFPYNPPLYCGVTLS